MKVFLFSLKFLSKATERSFNIWYLTSLNDTYFSWTHLVLRVTVWKVWRWSRSVVLSLGRPVVGGLSAAPLSRVWALHSFLLLLNAAHTVRPLPLPPRSPFPSLSLSLSRALSLSLHPSSHLSLTPFHPSRVTPVPLTPPRSTQSTAFISFLLPFRAYFASLERRCAFYALSAPDPSSNPNREEPLELAERFPTLRRLRSAEKCGN